MKEVCFMIIGCPKEIKTLESRVALTPSGVKALVKDGQEVLIEKGAGVGSGYPDKEYFKAGAAIIKEAKEVWARSELIIKVKEPLEVEYKYFRSGLIIFTYLHLACNKPLTEALLKTHVTALAYETYADGNQTIPMLDCMSEIAGKLAILEGANCLYSRNGGVGLLLPKLASLAPLEVTVIGAGHAGISAALLAKELGAHVSLLDIDKRKLQALNSSFPEAKILYSSPKNILASIKKADIVVLAALVPGGKAPILIHRADLKTMKKGSVIVDIAIDQCGCAETSHPTTHKDPIFIVDGVIHYCVANMPGIVARTSTLALTATTLPHLRKIAVLGLKELIAKDESYRGLVNTYSGKLTNEGVGKALSIKTNLLAL
jgi:alanine dehydrogenase